MSSYPSSRPRLVRGGPSDLQAPAPWRPPDEFHEYRLVRLLGQGSSGLVYLAQDTLLERPVAVKFITSLTPDAVGRFLIEARAAARLQHPNVLTLHRTGLVDGRPYLVSEFIRGQSLAELGKPIPWRRALELGVGLTRGLAAAHRRGILHRDIKPGNAIVAETGEIKLVDFGLAKFVESAAAAGVEMPPSSAAPDLRALAAAEALGLDDGPRALELTHHGAMVGTPHYMAPEIWRGELATRRSDVYSLGAVLYELCAGRPPHGEIPGPDLPRAARDRDPRALGEVAPGIDRRFAEIVARSLRRNPAERFTSADDLLAVLERLSADTTGALALPDGNPYRGLSPFGPEHRALYFGRSADIRAVVERLRADPFVLLGGDSGVGKSSLSFAGVLPRIEAGELGDGRVWSVISLVPGRRPAAALAAALSARIEPREKPLEQLLREEPQSLVRVMRKQLGASGGIVVFVDQLEELVTLGQAEETAAVAEFLFEIAAGVPGVRLLGTVRGDFLTRVAALPRLGDEVARALYLVRPLSREAIREAVVGPAHKTGFAFESEEVIEALVEPTARADGSLPLLQFTLAELWEARDGAGRLLTRAALEAIGGVSGALARHADGVLSALRPAERRAARRMLLRLVTLEGTRARRSSDELAAGDPSARSALDALVKGRLLVAREAEEGAAFEVAHEALLSGWGTLRRWLAEESDLRAALSRVESAAGEWERLGRAREALWGARQLREVARIDQAADLTPRERAFLEASRRAVRRRRLLLRAIAVTAPVVLALVYGGVRLQEKRNVAARVAQTVALADAALARAHELDRNAETMRRTALSRFDAQDRAQGEAAWSRVLVLDGDASRAYGEVGDLLESALALDGNRKDVRARFGELLLVRVERDERHHLPIASDEILRRLALYDDTGALARRFRAPASVSITTHPPGADVRIERVALAPQPDRRVVEVRAPGVTPLANLQLPPGSYVLLFALPGREVVRYPILLSRGEVRAIRVDLPAPAEVPPGFVYVPPGQFLFGSAGDDEKLREFFDTVPMHDMTTPGYYIARTETTYGDWIQFLEALAPAERARRLPRVGSLGSHGALALDQLPAGRWRLSIQPATRLYRALDGQSIVYAGRNQHARHDWLRFPVSGISFDDALAYVSWLSRSGRVPGARLCDEKEWERAARGADGREFPHGDRIEPDDANFDQTYGKQPIAFGPDEVSTHAASRSPFGLDDMAGNVWEWTRSALTAGESVVRGSCFYMGRSAIFTANRNVAEPSVRDLVVGMRVCADVSIEH